MTQHPEEGTLHAYIDGELSAAETTALELHVSACARCAAALAEARGFVAAASRVITTLDTAPSSSARPVAPVAGVPAAPLKRVVRPSFFRVPYARAAALLLLVGGTAVVVDRSGTFERGTSLQAESALSDAVAGSDLAATAPAEAATTPTTAPIQVPEAAAAVTATAGAAADLSTGAGSGRTGNVRREPVAPRPAPVATTTDGATRPRSVDRRGSPPEPAPAAFAGRGIAGGTAAGVVAKNAVPALALPSIPAGRDAAPEVAKPQASPISPPPPARMDMRLQERAAASASNFVPTVVRYRTADGIIVTLSEAPLRTSFAEDSVATRQRTVPRAQESVAAAMAASPINSYRWSSAELGKTYTLSGPLPAAELEALSKQLSELEKVP